jgi:hypothetical protein
VEFIVRSRQHSALSIQPVESVAVPRRAGLGKETTWEGHDFSRATKTLEVIALQRLRFAVSSKPLEDAEKQTAAAEAERRSTA